MPESPAISLYMTAASICLVTMATLATRTTQLACDLALAMLKTAYISLVFPVLFSSPMVKKFY